MAASALLSLGVKAMEANYAGLQTTGHNISNAALDGYTRQRVELATAQGQFTGAGFFGKGVDVVTVARDYNAFLSGQVVSTSSQAAYDDVRFEQLNALQDVFGGGEEGLGHAVGQVFNSLVDVASRPNDLSSRQVVLAQVADVAQRFNSAAQRIDSAQASVNQALDNSASQINGITAKIAEVNQRIAAFRGSDHAPNDLLDQRGQLVQELGGFMQLSTVLDSSDGTLSVFVAGGQRLVLGAQAVPLQRGPDPYDSSRSVLQVLETDGLHTLDTATLGGGSVGGLMRFQDDDLVQARNLIGQMALAVASAVNDQQAQGLDMAGASGAALFSLGGPQALPYAHNSGGGSVSLSIDDATLVKAAEYELFHDGSAWQVQERPDGPTQALGAGLIDGLAITLGSPPPAPGDRFLLQPVARVAHGMARAASDPRSIAAATAGSENANALALVALRDTALVQRLRDAGSGAVTGGSTLTDAWSNAMAEMGVRVQGARTAAEISASVSQGAQQALASVSGVNLDEEAANLMMYQQGYQAAAKVLQVAQSLFDTLLNAAT